MVCLLRQRYPSPEAKQLVLMQPDSETFILQTLTSTWPLTPPPPRVTDLTLLQIQGGAAWKAALWQELFLYEIHTGVTHYRGAVTWEMSRAMSCVCKVLKIQEIEIKLSTKMTPLGLGDELFLPINQNFCLWRFQFWRIECTPWISKIQSDVNPSKVRLDGFFFFFFLTSVLQLLLIWTLNSVTEY